MVSTQSLFPAFKVERVDPETAPHLMLGAASPLWLMFGGAAAAGATWWWWASRWREAVNLEAMIALAPEPVATPIPAPETLAAQVVDTVEAAVEAVVEPAMIVAEAAAEAVVETIEVASDSAVETVATLAETLDPTDVAGVESPMAEAAVAPVIEAVEAQVETATILADDLTRLVGVGPKLAASLGELGVTSFSQIAAWTPEDLQSIDQLLNLKGRADRDAWVAQAKRFAAADA
ncbi:MAG: hypothetical protein B7Z44_03310 [Caulobacter sp. 12-67-6]|nr:MAG: hypothetical protein B7Z44_03310 [Caulobacter sp. 12-67-6]OYX73891.1 MAG: hypothetical protein B7Y81_01430 [Caulobacter sp. 32-67-35]